MNKSDDPALPRKDPKLIQSRLMFPVVGIGASAGGLPALRTFFEHMPDNCGMAFVIILHLSPKHESSIDRILQANMGALIVGGALVVFAGRGLSDEAFYDELSLSQPPAYASTSLASPRDAGLLADNAALDAWLARMRSEPPPGAAWVTRGETQLASGRTDMRCEPGPKPRLALVATSGGGIRAAAWTAHVPGWTSKPST